jgi:hypothetical protein
MEGELLALHCFTLQASWLSVLFVWLADGQMLLVS